MKNILKTLGDTSLLRLGEMIRYNNRAKIKQESVATHSWVAATSVIRICKYFNIPKEIRQEALELVVIHDVGELATNDIPYDFKINNPKLKVYLEGAEIDFIEKNYPEFYDEYILLNKVEKEKTTVGILVKLADALSVYQYTKNELKLGNKTQEMQDIFDESEERVIRLVNELELSLGGK